jgi:hypothetical protein
MHYTEDLKKVTKLLEEYLNGKSNDPNWVKEANVSAMSMLEKVLKGVVGNIPIKVISAVPVNIEGGRGLAIDIPDNLLNGMQIGAAVAIEIPDGMFDVNLAGIQAIVVDSLDGLVTSEKKEVKKPCEKEVTFNKKPLKVDTNAAKYFVGKFANYYSNGRYYHNSEIVEFVPAGKQPSRYLWKRIGHHSDYIPSFRDFDSVVVKTTSGNYCYPNLNVHTEVGVV